MIKVFFGEIMMNTNIFVYIWSYNHIYAWGAPGWERGTNWGWNARSIFISQRCKPYWPRNHLDQSSVRVGRVYSCRRIAEWPVNTTNIHFSLHVCHKVVFIAISTMAHRSSLVQSHLPSHWQSLETSPSSPKYGWPERIMLSLTSAPLT